MGRRNVFGKPSIINTLKNKGDTMEIQLTKEEYRLLLDMLHISDWVMNSHKVEEDPKTQPYKRVEQKIMSYAKEFGFENLVEYDNKYDEYNPTSEFEDLESSMAFIEDYEDDVFWDELCHRLAQRDLIREKGLKKIQAMEPMARMLEEDKIAEKYDSEFVANGIENFIIAKK
jgi:hypothetical protein